MAGSDTSVTGSCHCECDHTGSCAVEEDKAEETGRKEWVGKSLHELDSEEYSHEQFLKGVQFLYGDEEIAMTHAKSYDILIPKGRKFYYICYYEGMEQLCSIL